MGYPLVDRIVRQEGRHEGLREASFAPRPRWPFSAASAASAADLDAIKARGYLSAATSGDHAAGRLCQRQERTRPATTSRSPTRWKKLGFEMRINKLDWKGILPGLQTGRFDAVFSNVNATDERKDGVRLLDPLLQLRRGGGAQGRTEGHQAATRISRAARSAPLPAAMTGEVPARAMEKEVGAFADFKGYAGYAEMFSRSRHRPRRGRWGRPTRRRPISFASGPASVKSSASRFRSASSLCRCRRGRRS